MQPSPDRPDPLESLIDRTLRAQPLRRAPRTLESRVLAEVARRAALPWWHKSYAHWPAAVRGGFLVLSALAAAVLFVGFISLSGGGASATLSEQFAWFGAAREVLTGVTNAGLTLWRTIPPLWIYTAVACAAVSYATLIAAGAAAYRAFLAPR